MRGKSQVVLAVGSLALAGCAAAMQYTVTADLLRQPSRVFQGDIFDIAGPSPAFTPPGGPSSEAPTLPGQPAEITRSEEHTSELQSRQYLVCRLLLEKKNAV